MCELSSTSLAHSYRETLNSRALWLGEYHTPARHPSPLCSEHRQARSRESISGRKVFGRFREGFGKVSGKVLG